MTTLDNLSDSRPLISHLRQLLHTHSVAASEAIHITVESYVTGCMDATFLSRDALQRAVTLWSVVRPSVHLSVRLFFCPSVCLLSLCTLYQGGKQSPICFKGIVSKSPME